VEIVLLLARTRKASHVQVCFDICEASCDFSFLFTLDGYFEV